MEYHILTKSQILPKSQQLQVLPALSSLDITNKMLN